MFSVSKYGWLEYAPFKTGVTLPALGVSSLQWPGVLEAARQDDSIPAEIAEAWPVKTTARAVNGRYPLAALVAAGLPDEVPEAIAYHLAVNFETYRTLRPVAGLPAESVRLVIERGRFALDATYRDAANYLKQVCETNWRHPLLTDFDTEVRDRSAAISLEAARLYFYTLGDRLIRDDDDDDDDSLWPELATYLFWVGRTGMANYGRYASLFAEETDGELSKRLAAWNPFDTEGPMALARVMAHVK